MNRCFAAVCAVFCLVMTACSSSLPPPPPVQSSEWVLFNDTGHSIIALFLADDITAGNTSSPVAFEHLRAYDQQNIGSFHRLWNQPPQVHKIIVLSAESVECLKVDFSLTEGEKSSEVKDTATGKAYTIYQTDQAVFDKLLRICPVLGNYGFTDMQAVMVPPFDPSTERIAVKQDGRLALIANPLIQQRWQRQKHCWSQTFNVPTVVAGAPQRVEIVPDKRTVCRESYSLTPQEKPASEQRAAR